MLQETANKKRKWRPTKAKINFHFRYGRVSQLCFVWFKHMWMCQVNEIYLYPISNGLVKTSCTNLFESTSIYIIWKPETKRIHIQFRYIVTMYVAVQSTKNVFKKNKKYCAFTSHRLIVVVLHAFQCNTSWIR